MRDENGAIVHDGAHGRYMAKLHPAIGNERHDGADPRFVSALVVALGLIPPCPGVAIDLDAGNRAGKGHAFPVIAWLRLGERNRADRRGKASQDQTSPYADCFEHICTPEYLPALAP